jgi:hypothetical protein
MTDLLQRLETVVAPLLPRAISSENLRLLAWLSQPLDLKGAGALSDVLGRYPEPHGLALHAQAAATARSSVLAVRGALLQDIAGSLAALEANDPPSRRRLYTRLQREMELRIHGLRMELRKLLAAASPRLAQLVALDETLGKRLGHPLEKACDCLPDLLAQQAEMQAAQLRDLLLAELDTRLQPAFGLLAALEEHTEGN